MTRRGRYGRNRLLGVRRPQTSQEQTNDGYPLHRYVSWFEYPQHAVSGITAREDIPTQDGPVNIAVTGRVWETLVAAAEASAFRSAEFLEILRVANDTVEKS